MTTTTTTRRRRRSRPAWIRYPLLILTYALAFPIVKVLEIAGRWPRAMSRVMARMMGEFGDYVPHAHDVLVCSYFKSGTNWTMHIALQIAHRGRARFDHIHDLVPWPEMPVRARYAVAVTDDSARQDSPTGLRVIKTHLPLAKLPYNTSARYIWIARDPKDVFVSSYLFIKSMALGPLMPSVRKWLELYLSPDTPLGSWAEHLQGGWLRRNEPNVLFLTYEEMKADLRGAVARIARFMGVNLTREELELVVEQTTYAHMKSIGHKFEPPGSPWTKSGGAMIRRGEAGASGELLTPADQRRIDDHWRAELERLDCDFPYDEAFAVAAHHDAAPETALESMRV